MLDKYIKVEDRPIVSGQDGKTGLWYCKELVTKTVKETDVKIGELNDVYNKYNTEEIKKKEKTEKKKPEKKEPPVTGLK